jgi:hypothetical protein
VSITNGSLYHLLVGCLFIRSCGLSSRAQCEFGFPVIMERKRQFLSRASALKQGLAKRLAYRFYDSDVWLSGIDTCVQKSRQI